MLAWYHMASFRTSEYQTHACIPYQKQEPSPDCPQIGKEEGLAVGDS